MKTPRIIERRVYKCQDCLYGKEIQFWMEKENASAVCCDHPYSQRTKSPNDRDIYSTEIPDWCPLPKAEFKL